MNSPSSCATSPKARLTCLTGWPATSASSRASPCRRRDQGGDRVPLSRPAEKAFAIEPRLLATLLNAGDDYEIVAAVPGASGPAFEAEAKGKGVPVTQIGRLESPEAGLLMLGPDGHALKLDSGGYAHFGSGRLGPMLKMPQKPLRAGNQLAFFRGRHAHEVRPGAQHWAPGRFAELLSIPFNA